LPAPVIPITAMTTSDEFGLILTDSYACWDKMIG
jgi:hypothetical protein